MALLARREHSRWELCQKLQAKGFSEDTVNEVVAALADEGLQSDQRFTESFIRQRIREGCGPLRIAQELQQRGIVAADLDSMVREATDGWDELLLQTYLKRYSTNPHMPRSEWAKRCRFLQQRGFSYDLIRALGKRLNLKFNA